MNSDSFKFECPSCGQRLSVTLDDAGASAECPTCGKPLVVPNPPIVSPQSQQPSSPQLGAEIDALCEHVTRGTPTTFMCYGSDEALFMARLKPFSAYARTRNGKFTVVGVRDDAKNDFMIVCSGSISEDAVFSAASNSGGAVDKLDHALLSQTELRMRRPVDAYSNFAQPGCVLTSLGGFTGCVEALRSGRYKVVEPDMKAAAGVAEPDTKPPATPKTELDMVAIRSALTKLQSDLRQQRNLGLPISTLEVRTVMSRDCIAWVRPDDGSKFDSDRATQLLKKQLAPLGINFWMGGHTTGGRDLAMCYWFMEEAQQ